MTQPKKIEEIPLWQTVSKIANYADSLITELPEEEKWGIINKLRTRALDVTSDVAEAYGSIDPRDMKWSLGMARRDLFGLKNSLRISHERDYVKVDPIMMLTIDKAVNEIDREIKQASKNIPKWFKEMDAPSKKSKK